MDLIIPEATTYIQENPNGPLIRLQGSLANAMVQTPYSIRYDLKEPDVINPSVVALFTRENQGTYALQIMQKPNGLRGEFLMELEINGILPEDVQQKINVIFDRYIGFGGGGRRRLKRRRTHKKLNRRRRRSLRHRKAK